MLNLIASKGPDQGRVYQLSEGKLHLLGRFNRVMSVFVTDLKVSRIHAELTCDHQQWYIRDVQSTNGTFINGKRVVGKIALQHRDQIRIGSTILAVDLHASNRTGGGKAAATPAYALGQTSQTAGRTDSQPAADRTGRCGLGSAFQERAMRAVGAVLTSIRPLRPAYA